MGPLACLRLELPTAILGPRREPKAKFQPKYGCNKAIGGCSLGNVLTLFRRISDFPRFDIRKLSLATLSHQYPGLRQAHEAFGSWEANSPGLRPLRVCHEAATASAAAQPEAVVTLQSGEFAGSPSSLEDVIANSKTGQALKVLESTELTREDVCIAALAFSKKNGSRGLVAVEALARERGLLQGPPSSKAWFGLIKAYGVLKRLDDVRRCFRAAQNTGAWQGTSEDMRNTTIFLNAMHTDLEFVFARTKLMMDASVPLETGAFNVLLKACMRAKDGAKARTVLDLMDAAGAQPDEITMASLIKALSYADDFEGVLSVRDIMEDRQITPTPGVWGALLVACGAARQHETALMLWRELKVAMGGPEMVPANVYNAMLTACNASRQGERSLMVFNEMVNARVVPTVTTYNLAIKACASNPGQRPRPEQLLTALTLYMQMREAGLVPDEFTYGTLMELCAEGRQGRVAAQLQERMVRDGVKANMVIYTSLMKALTRSGMVEQALAVFGKMIWGPARLKPTRATFRVLVRELREQGALAAALRVYTGMRRAHFAPNNRDFQELIAAAAETALANGDPELQQQVAALCNISSVKVVDLHGMSTYEARAAVLCVLSMLVTQYQRGEEPVQQLTIITGRGSHTDGGKAVLPVTVRRLLHEELHIPLPPPTDYKKDGSSKVVRSSGNPGRIVLEEETLLHWLRARSHAARQLAYPGLEANA